MLRHQPVPIINLSDVLEMKAGDDVEDIFSIVVVRFFQKR